jgi:opacity protein-like surface antigen
MSSTVRGRLGASITPYAIAYATGGVAYGETEHVGRLFGFGTGVDDTGAPIIMPVANSYVSRTTKSGWVAGGGIEARLAGNVTGRIEYLHLDLGHDSGSTGNILNTTPLVVSFNSHVTEDLVRLGFNYKFDPYVTAVPAYPAQTNGLGRMRPIFKPPGVAMQRLAPWSWTGF